MTRSNAGAPRCVLSEEVEVGRATTRASDVSLAFAGPERGLVMWSSDASHVRARPIGAGTALGPVVESELGRAHGMSTLEAVGDRYLVITRGDMCAPGGSACMHARAYGPGGDPAGPALDEPLTGHQMIEIAHWVPLPEGGVIATATRWGGANARRYRVAPDGSVSAETIVECCAGWGPSEGTYPMLAPAGEGVLIIGLHEESLGDDASFSLLRWPGGTPRPIGAIPEGARVLAAAAIGEESAVIFRAPDQPRPSLVRLDARGRAIGRPLPVRADTALPAELAETVSPRLELARGRLMLRRVDAAEREVGEPIEIARLSGSRHAAAVAFSGRDFAIVYGSPSAGEWTYSLRRADCADPGRPAP